jgi:starch phosphorylase
MKKPLAPPALKHSTLDAESIRQSLYNRLIYTVGKDPLNATDQDWFFAAAAVVRERVIERWMETMRSYYVDDRKRVYYLSLEFLMGRTMTNSMLNICAEKEFQEALVALSDMGLRPENLREVEPDAALGNGGLGRLAACFLDSMATLGVPGYGYGIRYEYGMFHQSIENGQQIEHPDNWLRHGNPWEFPRPEVLYHVKFHGRVVDYIDEHGRKRHQWVDSHDVMAMAYDYPIPGFNTDTVNNMRLWAAKATRDFDLKHFNEGEYIRAVESKNESENLSKVLYPNDTTEMGRELRLKQQYFFVSASLQDLLFRFAKSGASLDKLPEKVAIQLNDTHPSIAVAELMRILIDLHHMDWGKAWNITTRTFAYTNHTLMPEARMAAARMCRLRASKSAAKLP